MGPWSSWLGRRLDVAKITGSNPVGPTPSYSACSVKLINPIHLPFTMDMEKIGRYVFLLGLVISVLAGFVNLGFYGGTGLFVLGIVVGVLNVTGKEVQKFLLATVALMLVGASVNMLSALPGGGFVSIVIAHFTVFVAGGALIVALKEVYGVTKTK